MRLARDLKVTQKSAWFMLHRIRLALREDRAGTMGSHWGNPIEVDETFVGGKMKNMHRKRAMALRAQVPIDRMEGYETNLKNKTVVMGMLNRETRKVRAKVIPNVKRETLQTEILKNVGHNAHIFTDQHVGYDGLEDVNNFTHRTVNHLTEYVRGRVHTQGIENFWSLLKRGLNGTYVAVEPFHLDAYVDEQVFRYNNRATKDNPLHRRGSLRAGSHSGGRKAPNLCRTDRQGGRGGSLLRRGRDAGSGSLSLPLFLCLNTLAYLRFRHFHNRAHGLCEACEFGIVGRWLHDVIIAQQTRQLTRKGRDAKA